MTPGSQKETTNLAFNMRNVRWLRIKGRSGRFGGGGKWNAREVVTPGNAGGLRCMQNPVGVGYLLAIRCGHPVASMMWNTTRIGADGAFLDRNGDFNLGLREIFFGQIPRIVLPRPSAGH